MQFFPTEDLNNISTQAVVVPTAAAAVIEDGHSQYTNIQNDISARLQQEQENSEAHAQRTRTRINQNTSAAQQSIDRILTPSDGIHDALAWKQAQKNKLKDGLASLITTNKTTRKTQNFLEQGEQRLSASTLSSFISPDRLDYTGRPKGFAAFEEKNATMPARKDGSLRLDDLTHLKEYLQLQNVPPISIQTLEQLAGEQDNVSIGRLLGALSGTSRSSLALDEGERDAATQVLGKLGLNTDQISEWLWLAEEGNTQEAWKSLSLHIENLGEKDITLHKNELSALVRGLDLTPQAQKTIESLFAQAGTETFALGDLKTLLAEAGSEMAVKAKAHEIMKQALPAALDAVLAEAKRNELGSASADIRASSRVLGQETRTQVAIEKQVISNASENVGTNAVGINEESLAENEDDFTDNEQAQQSFAQTQAPRANDTPIAPKDETTPLHTLISTFEHQGPIQKQSVAQTTPASTHRQEIFSQVERGIVNTLQTGATRITLHINPEHLGQVNIILTMHDGAIKAVLRAENSEAAAMLTEQIAELKTQLEQNGIKVAELDVQTGLREDFSSSHNQNSHEHNEMFQAEKRARHMRLARLRRETAEPAQQTNSQPALQETGLHLVA